MAEPKFKYKINALLTDLPRSIDVVDQLITAGIPERTFFRDRAILQKENSDIPGERLLIYARFFNVPIEGLYNYSKKVKPIHRIKTGLKVTAFILFLITLQGCVSYSGLNSHCPAYSKAPVTQSSSTPL